MQLFLGAVPTILTKLEDTCYSQIIPRIICQSLQVASILYMKKKAIKLKIMDKLVAATVACLLLLLQQP